MFAAVLLLTCGSEPVPAFTVENKCPAFTVVNKVVPLSDTYADAYARVLAGERLTWTGTPPGMPQGTYECWLEGGLPRMERQVSQVAAGKSLTSRGTAAGTVGTSQPREQGLGLSGGMSGTSTFMSAIGVVPGGSTSNCASPLG